MSGKAARPGVHRHRHVVRFGDCDPAGIVYFPRFFDLFHQAMETWFAEGLGIEYHVAIRDWRVGFPTVHTEADYRRPCRLGDRLVVELCVAQLGSRSMRLAYAVRGEDDAPNESPRATGATVCTVIGLDPAAPDHLKARPIPPMLRERIERFRQGAPAAG